MFVKHGLGLVFKGIMLLQDVLDYPYAMKACLTSIENDPSHGSGSEKRDQTVDNQLLRN